MNTKSTELNKKFDYPNCPKFTKHVKDMLLFTFVGWVGVIILISLVVSNADKIDKFFQQLYKMIV